MWKGCTESLASEKRKYELVWKNKKLTYREVITLWSSSREFRGWFSSLLAASSFKRFYFEVVPVALSTLDREFEFVLIDYPARKRSHVHLDTFGDYFRALPEEEVLAFPNFGEDAMLVVPAPRTALSVYSDLGSFVRCAPAGQVDALWKRVGEVVFRSIGEQPLWLCTVGIALHYLHIRLDERPKFIRYLPYRDIRY